MTQEKYDMRDDFYTRVDTLPHSAVSDVLPSCPYNPSYLVSKKLLENEALKRGYVSLVPLYFVLVRVVPIEHVLSVKSLGIFIDENLRWQTHIDKLSKKVRFWDRSNKKN